MFAGQPFTQVVLFIVCCVKKYEEFKFIVLINLVCRVDMKIRFYQHRTVFSLPWEYLYLERRYLYSNGAMGPVSISDETSYLPWSLRSVGPIEERDDGQMKYEPAINYWIVKFREKISKPSEVLVSEWVITFNGLFFRKADREARVIHICRVIITYTLHVHWSNYRPTYTIPTICRL